MTPNNSPNPTGDRPEFDPQRSAEIRELLTRTVAGTPRPRPARLSRTAFSLAASAALFAAVGVGAGGVLAVDQVVSSNASQDALAPQLNGTESGQDEAAQATDGFTAASALPTGLRPVLTLNGETGYAYAADLATVEALSISGAEATTEQFLEGQAADASVPPGTAADAQRVPIYRADGITVIGYVEPGIVAP